FYKYHLPPHHLPSPYIPLLYLPIYLLPILNIPTRRSSDLLPSMVSIGGEARSRILADLPAGTTVTTPRHQVDVEWSRWCPRGGRDRKSTRLNYSYVEMSYCVFWLIKNKYSSAICCNV